MRLADIRQLAADMKKLTRENRATGPRTEQGKFRSALNATKHGLAGKNILLPGENQREYTERMDAVFESLAPRNEAQAQLAALIGDDLWKLERLGKMERGLGLARIEELLAQTSSAEAGSALMTAIPKLACAITEWESEPMPTAQDEEFRQRYILLSDAINAVQGSLPDVPARTLNTCVELLERVRGANDDSPVERDTCLALAHAARVLMSTLIEYGAGLDAVQNELRKAIATMALPDEAELRKLARYTKLLEESLQRRLSALDQFRKLEAEKTLGGADVERAKEYRMRLRVVTSDAAYAPHAHRSRARM